MMGGSQMARACIHDGCPSDSLELYVPPPVRQVRRPWPALAARAAPGPGSLPARRGKQVVAEVRSSGRDKELGGGARLGARSFGITQAALGRAALQRSREPTDPSLSSFERDTCILRHTA